jgi:hypothetical protein
MGADNTRKHGVFRIAQLPIDFWTAVSILTPLQNVAPLPRIAAHACST